MRMANTARWTAPPGQGVAILYLDRANRLTGAYMNCPHCETHVDEHEATRCFDAWIAEVVMERTIPDDHDWRDYHCDCFPKYSHKISAAWEVVEKLAEQRKPVQITKTPISYWLVDLWGTTQTEQWKAKAETAPLAICRAAIKVSQ